ncbi:MAG TPA: hypothetical protein VGP04_12035 [Pseudonocardiaceae bacterium]|nr:hypothetical protein [Pseudonocardiaceae bacterium]
MAYGRCSKYAAFRDSDQYRHTEAALKRAGILHSDHRPLRPPHRDDTHIAHQRGEHTISTAR